jgi:hypothetical protein
MSQTGNLIWYTREVLAHPEPTLLRILAWLGATQIGHATRTLGESQEWALLQAWKLDDDVSPYDEDEFVCQRGVVADLAGLYKPGRRLSIDIGKTPRGSRIWEEHQKLDPKLRGDYQTGSPIICLGHHDLIDQDQETESVFVARAFCSLKMFGYGTPANDAAYRAMIWQQPFVREIGEEFAAIIAPARVEHACSWSY